MAEKVGQLAELHANQVEPQVHDHRDLAGGDEPEVASIKSDAARIHVEEADSHASDEPTEEELASLRKIPEKLPWSSFLVAAVELCERFAYYGLKQNYIQHPYKGPSGIPGALGLGQAAATGLNSFFQFWCYVTPIIGAIVADQYLGRYNTIIIFASIYICGLVVLVCTSFPFAIENGSSLGGLIAAMIIIGLGTGGIKSNISPLIAEQVKTRKRSVRTLKSGERVIVDPSKTIERIYLIFYMCINIGSLSPIATTSLELHVNFWAAYLLPACMFVVGFVVLIVGKRYYIVRPPRGSVIIHAFKAMWIGLINKCNMEAAKVSYQAQHGGTHTIPWSDHFVDEMKRALVACKVFVYFPIYWVCYQQMLTNFLSQAATMELHGIPNDIMQNIDPLTIIIFIPICDRIVYPLLRKMGIPFRPITRITMGFLFASISMGYAAIVQRLIYNSPPCYSFPMECPASNDGELPNKIHVAVQTPAYLFIGLSEIFTSITGLEYAYTKAPESMKSFVMAMFLLTSAFGSALAIALSPTAKNPKLLWMYTGLAIASAIAGGIFWFLFKRYNDTEEEMNALSGQEAYEEKPVAANAITLTGKANPEAPRTG
ncbi:peptide transporter ptr2 [Onygenales sp. PD_40]|nr:peptide transporter ptr2 [Onygenales sp. PD_40]KAK2773790.1 peptide transporter ptr2 [Emmonsiellopsis sp. PD_33]KAK2777343.1 peptide transporter ptr2 [Onygenales sp. PD_12]KAK2803929.1 peptide transporter ptr2 [Onygenales sp. PD_10]